MRRLAVISLAFWLPLAASADCVDTASNDCDGDGFAASAGDCDDEDDSIHPGADDGCNGVDDDCDGSTDEDCSSDNPLADATLVGGSSCPSGSAAWLVLLPIAGLGRRRS